MEWKYSRMNPKKARAHLSAGLLYLRYTVKLLAARHHKGKYFLFENPRTSRSFLEPEVKALMKLDGEHA
eukprot:4446965-Pyramimonas_sp.AAC.1